jgi:hypothetical protein
LNDVVHAHLHAPILETHLFFEGERRRASVAVMVKPKEEESYPANAPLPEWMVQLRQKSRSVMGQTCGAPFLF